MQWDSIPNILTIFGVISIAGATFWINRGNFILLEEKKRAQINFEELRAVKQATL